MKPYTKTNYTKGPVRITGLSVEVKDGNVERALKNFSKKVQTSGKLKEYKDRGEFVKPSVQKRLARKEAVIRTRLQGREDKS